MNSALFNGFCNFKPNRESRNRIANFADYADHRPWTYIERFDGNPEYIEELKHRLNHNHERLEYDAQAIFDYV